MTPDQLTGILDGLYRGESQRQIARRVHVGRDTIGAVARGEPVTVDEDDATRAMGTRRLRRPIRCPGCGARVDTLPCLTCGIEASRQVDRDLCHLQPLGSD